LKQTSPPAQLARLTKQAKPNAKDLVNGK